MPETNVKEKSGRRIHTQYLFALTPECKALGWEPGDPIVATTKGSNIMVANLTPDATLANRLKVIIAAEKAKIAEVEAAKKAKEAEKQRVADEKAATVAAEKAVKEKDKAARAEAKAKKEAEAKAKKQPSEPKEKVAKPLPN